METSSRSAVATAAWLCAAAGAAFWGAVRPAGACTSGVAAGNVTADGRPLLWKSRMEKAAPNDVRFYPAGEDHDGDGAPDPYGFLGIGAAGDTLRMGLNSRGVATGANTLNPAGDDVRGLPHPIILGNFSTVTEVKARYAAGGFDAWRHILFAIDPTGAACLWEGQAYGQEPPTYYEYDVTAPARDRQHHDGVALSGWVVRANEPGHYRTDGSDNPAVTEARYLRAMTVVTRLLKAGNLSARSIMERFLRDPKVFHHRKSTILPVSSMVVHGVRPREDPRLTTMWAMVGHAQTGIFVPLWVHGLEAAGGSVPAHLTYDAADPRSSMAHLADGMKAGGWDVAQVAARTVPFDAHLFDAVAQTLLPEWRARSDWDAIGQEMNRVSLRMSEDAHALLAYLERHGAGSGNAPAARMDPPSVAGRAVSLRGSGFDDDNLDGEDDGEAVTLAWNYGGPGRLLGDRYTYDKAGVYLVSLTVTDAESLSQTAWAFVRIPPP